MKLAFELGPEYRRAVNQLDAAADAIRQAAADGLLIGGHYAAGTVKADYLSGQALKRRSGQLAANVTAWPDGDLTVAIGVPDGSPVAAYAWLLGDETKTITPKKGKYLTIPIGENLTPTGQAKYSSPRDVPDGFFFRSKSGSLLFGYRAGKTDRARVRPLFVLKPSVTVIGSGALIDGVMDSIDDIGQAIEDELNQIEGFTAS